MFHIYFGAFDAVLYLGGIYFAIALAKTLCDQMDEADVAQTVIAPRVVAPMQPIAPHLAAPAAKREAVNVKVSVN